MVRQPINTGDYNKLDDLNKDLLERVSRKPWLVHKLIRVFNSMCEPCKKLAKEKTTRPLSDYCVDCQIKVTKQLNAIKEKLG